MGNLTLADELLLLAYNDYGTAEIRSPAFDYGLAGALLIDLTLAERIAVQDGRIAVISAAQVGDGRLDEALVRIAGDRRRKPQDWIKRLSHGLRDKTLTAMIGAGVLRRERDTVLWVFQQTRYPSVDGAEPAAETDIRRRLAAAVMATGSTEPRTAAMCALVRAVKLDKAVFAGLPADVVRARLREIAAGEWAAAATRKAIEEMEAAVMVAIMMPVIASSASG